MFLLSLGEAWQTASECHKLKESCVTAKRKALLEPSEF